jgi:hypothetical protein
MGYYYCWDNSNVRRISHEIRDIIAQPLIKNGFQPDWITNWNLGSKNFGGAFKHGCAL